MNFYVPGFSNIKAAESKFDLALPYKRSRSTQHHHLNQFGSTWAPDATYQVSQEERREKILNVITYIDIGAMLVMWPGLFEHNFCSLNNWRLYTKFGYN